MTLTLVKTADGLVSSLLLKPAKKLLVGEGPAALNGLKRIISESGALDSRLLGEHYPKPEQTFLKSIPRKIKHVALGEKPLEILKQRLMQGGLVGKGGVLHGAYAFNPELVDKIKEPGMNFKKLREMAPMAAGDAINHIWLSALPAYGAVKAVQAKDPEELGRVLGDTAGWAIGGPMGMAGGLVANHTADMGKKMMAQAELPRIQTQYDPYAYDQLQS